MVEKVGVEGGGKRYALLQAVKDSEYVKKMYGGYLNVFVAAFGDEGEKWDLLMVVDGVFPAMNELQNYAGFIITGSTYDAYGNESWILDLCFLLQNLDAMGKKLLGICFGHQVLYIITSYLCILHYIFYIIPFIIRSFISKNSDLF